VFTKLIGEFLSFSFPEKFMELFLTDC